MAIKFLLATTGMQMNMVSSWTDELYCSILKDGSISLRASKDGEDEYGGRWWFPSRRGIKTAKQFVEAIELMDEIEVGNWSLQEDILPILFQYDQLRACLINLYLEIEDTQNEEDVDFFEFCEKTISRSVIVLPKDFQSAIKVIQQIYEFIKAEVYYFGKFPTGKLTIVEHKVEFPERVPSTIKVRNFMNQQVIKVHVSNAIWTPPKSKYQTSEKVAQTRKILDFCKDYLKTENTLPIGHFNVGKISVKFTDSYFFPEIDFQSVDWREMPPVISVKINNDLSAEYEFPHINELNEIGKYFKKTSIHNDVVQTLRKLKNNNFKFEYGEIILSEKYKLRIRII